MSYYFQNKKNGNFFEHTKTNRQETTEFRSAKSRQFFIIPYPLKTRRR